MLEVSYTHCSVSFSTKMAVGKVAEDAPHIDAPSIES